MTTTDQVGTELRRETRLAALLRRYERHRRALEVQSTLGTAELRLLWLLTDGRPRTLREISEALHLEQSTVNRQVNGAVQAGLLSRTRASGSSSYEFSPTAEGRDTFDRETALPLAIYARVLDELGDDDARRLLELLGRFVDLYGREADRRES